MGMAYLAVHYFFTGVNHNSLFHKPFGRQVNMALFDH